MNKAADLRYRTLAMAFTPQEGLLLAVDQAGWLTIWAPLTNSNVDKFRIPFGPFRSAAFDGQFVVLVPEEGPPVRWDIVEKRVVNVKARPSRFDLKNGGASLQDLQGPAGQEGAPQAAPGLLSATPHKPRCSKCPTWTG